MFLSITVKIILLQEKMHDMLSEKGHIAKFQYTSEEGGTDNRIYTIECTVESLVVKVVISNS